ncbi:MAG: DNA-directed RNA polymerase subunit omega [Christensenellaceae bacterium]|nr:DNA-directed RNA polymerase subunit omega [Christensenellaceae bacterium]
MSNQMNHPPVVELEQKAGCRYMLVTTVAKRARQLLVSKSEAETNTKPVSHAVDELYNDKLKIKYPNEYFQTSEK